jgi:hypothetical protein
VTCCVDGKRVRAGRLVPLLKGVGLNRSTIEELLRPESLSALRAILTDHLFPSPGEPTERIGATGDSNTWKTGPSTIRATATTLGREAETVRRLQSSILFGTEEG